MEVLQAAAWYPPYSLGGTEVYVESLVDELTERGVRCDVVVPRLGSAAATYVHRGTTVSTYEVGGLTGPTEMRDGRPHEGFGAFLEVLAKFGGSIYHQHSWTRGCGLQHLLAARDRRLKTVITVHVPGVTCMRGTMMRFGETVCNGEIEPRTCAACYLKGRGLPYRAAKAASAFPMSVAQRASRVPGSLMTAIAMPYLAKLRRKEIEAMFQAADRVVAVCDWLAEALRANGVPEEKLVLSRQGLPNDLVSQLGARSASVGSEGREPLKLVFLGRMDPTKGLDVLLKAMLSLPLNLPVQLTVHTVPADAENAAFSDRMLRLGATDPRIRFAGAVSREEIPAVLLSHQVLCAPSQWLETGPLVALEAMAAGLHVLGSDMGGLRELVEPGEGGTLIEPANVDAWVNAIGHLVRVHQAGQLISFKRSVRTMGDAADDMLALYRSIR